MGKSVIGVNRALFDTFQERKVSRKSQQRSTVPAFLATRSLNSERAPIYFLIISGFL